jgi:dTDP-4-amino-4,6-dideoxygalactose transaminase
VIPFNRPFVTGAEVGYIQDAVRRGHLSGDGFYTEQCSKMLSGITGATATLLTTSCTHALEMSALLLDLQPGDEVVLPSFTFVSTVNAFVLRGARPVFVDIRPDTLNIDERLVEAAITPRTKAVVVVHYAGVACEMDTICDVAARHGIAVIEDAAHALGAGYRGRPLGSIGVLGTLSFHETKNLHCGEGGALLVNDPSLLERAEIMREKGTNRSQFFRGQVDKYTWVGVGSSYLPSDLLAAFLFAQLEGYDEIQRARMAVWQAYAERLAGWAEERGYRLPYVPEHCTHPAHLFYVLLRDLDERQAFIRHLHAHGVKVVFHYVPLHNSPQGLALGGGEAHCPVTEDVSDRLVRLPVYAGLTDAELEQVIDATLAFG